MKYFEGVEIVTDDRFSEIALAVRSALEVFRLNVTVIRLVNNRQCLDYFGGRTESDATVRVLASHGFTSNDGLPGLRFEVRDIPSRDQAATSGWQFVNFDLTPATIGQKVSGLSGTVLSLACGGGREPLAKAFLSAGASEYIGSDAAGVDTDASILFAIGFFYFLLAEDRDFAPSGCSVRDAVDRAAGFDPGWPQGTEPFKYYARS